MGVKVGNRRDNKYVSGLSKSDLEVMVSRGGRDGEKARRELAKRGN